ncbi:MAG: type II toxin-antitoxin system RelE/ParE family toxin [Planctomycetota bacterium]|nr:type II toxin-antitoxin system RelE/ParE family toxin [Planctomycetota bacterium]
MAYAVQLTPAAERDLKKLERAIRARVVRALEGLASEPRPQGSTKLSGKENLWRVRVGDHRVLYAIEDRRLVVLVVKIAHRREVYR